MVTLSPIEPSTIRAIYEQWEKNHKTYDSVGIPIGELGNDCDRALWYTLRWASEPKAEQGFRLRRMEAGNIEEQRLIDDLRRVPTITIVDTDPETGKQIKVYSHGGHVRGKLDGQVYGLPEAPKTWHVVECKKRKAANWRAVVKHGVQKATPKHYAQCQFYMHLTGLDRCLYLIQNGDTDELHCERLRLDPVFIAQLCARLENVILSNRAPERISKDPECFACRFCNHKNVCHQIEFVRNHCRTCINSTPQLDHDDTSAPWLCEKWNKVINLDEQKAGCHAHLYLPEVVPGEQVDAGNDFVAYKMRDGSTWTDQEQKAPPEPEADIRYWWSSATNELVTTLGGTPPLGCTSYEELSAEEYAQAVSHFASAAQ